MFKRNRYYSDGKKIPPFWIFILPITISFTVGFFLLKKYPIPIAILFVSFCITFVLLSLRLFYGGVKQERYFQKHNFQLWKKSYRRSLRERQEAAKEMGSLVKQITYLEKSLKSENKFAFILLTIWTLIFIVIFSLIIFSAIYGFPFSPLTK